MMQAPFILWDNILADSTLTASATASGYAADNLTDMRTHTYWAATGESTYTIQVNLGAASARTANAVGIAAHNLYSIGSTIIIQTSSNGSSWVGRSTFSCTSDDPHISTFSGTSAIYWRVVINCPASSTPKIGILSLGTHLNFPNPPISGTSPMEQSIKTVANHSQVGVLLGNTIKCHPMEASLTFTYIASTFFRSTAGAPANYGEFWKDHGRYLRPFFISFSQDTFPEHRYFMRLNDKSALKTPLYNQDIVQGFTVDMISCPEATT